MDKNESISISTANTYTYYDLLALLCHCVNELEQSVREKLGIFIAVNLPQCVRKATEKFPQLSIKSPLAISGYTNLDVDAAASLFDFINGISHLQDWAIVLGVISNLDTALPIKENFSTFLEGRNCKVLEDEYGGVSESYYEFKALNLKTKDQYGLILPNLYCEWSKKTKRTREKVAYNPLAFALNNYIWACKNDQWQITNLYCDFRGKGFDKASIDREDPFRIISSPLGRQAPFILNLDKEKNLFYVEYLPECNDVLMERLRSVINYAVKEKADIVMFPEMMGTCECIDFCKEYISMAFWEWRPKLFLLPSWEHKEDGTWYNTLYGLDANGDCIFKYNKQHAFILEHEESASKDSEKIPYCEPIQPDGNVFIIHIPGIGRIGIIICADIFKEGYLERLVKDLKVTLLLYPAFSSGIDLMVRAMTEMIKYSCDIVFCNTCAAWDKVLALPKKREENNSFNSEFVGFYCPGGHGNHENIGKPFTACNKSVCRGCLAITELAKKYTTSLYASRYIRLEEI